MVFFPIFIHHQIPASLECVLDSIFCLFFVECRPLVNTLPNEMQHFLIYIILFLMELSPIFGSLILVNSKDHLQLGYIYYFPFHFECFSISVRYVLVDVSFFYWHKNTPNDFLFLFFGFFFGKSYVKLLIRISKQTSNWLSHWN